MKIIRHYHPYMLRPAIYMAAFRLMLALIFLLLVTRFLPNSPAPSFVAAFLTVLFALFAYLVYLRMDGMRIPRIKYLRPKKKSDPLRSAASMNDHMDDEPSVTFEELEPEEKDFCSFIASLINFIIFLVLSFVL